MHLFMQPLKQPIQQIALEDEQIRGVTFIGPGAKEMGDWSLWNIYRKFIVEAVIFEIVHLERVGCQSGHVLRSHLDRFPPPALVEIPHHRHGLTTGYETA